MFCVAYRAFTPETSAPGLPRNYWYSVICTLIVLYYSLRSLKTDSKCCRLKTARMLQQHLSSLVSMCTVPPKHQWSRHCWGSLYQPPAIIFRSSDVFVVVVAGIVVVVVAVIEFVVMALLLLLCWC